MSTAQHAAAARVLTQDLSRKLVHISAGLAFVLSWSLYR